MALTNKEIIAHEILLHGITEPVNTFASWKAQGYHIKKEVKPCLLRKFRNLA